MRHEPWNWLLRQSAAWKYRAIYVLDDQPVGQWSDTVGIAVMGQ